MLPYHVATVVISSLLLGCHTLPATHSGRWNENYAYADKVPPITFHYDHGVLAGSYPEGVETVAIRFEDVCAQLGHVCLCGAGGFRRPGVPGGPTGHPLRPGPGGRGAGRGRTVGSE